MGHIQYVYSVCVCGDANGMFLNPLAGHTEENRQSKNTLEPDIKIKRKSPFSSSTFVAHIHHLIKHDDHPRKKTKTLGHCQNVYVCFHMAACIKLFPDQKT